ncbi:DUF418 domain-containing protein [Altererythrobacter xixiisoli]|uniref:DUF418 domain-containing protein n=1 Tax=Croceibacterium xixiisoli TaxID=1476466 RepID=A0A6I4TQ57_9SPHN|nr:DUF418 domain-containing protein [Croceibacterium xixiisoli]MXO98082.1 DUF418 domain-containing protein [Croceibacterium xixiisoli]
MPLAPVAHDRLLSLDFIRGLAVMGILFSNITAFAHPTLAYSWPGALPAGGWVSDGWVWLFQFVLVDGKFRGLFTLLFGAGLYLFSERLLAGGADDRVQMRRLFWLLIVGLLHFVLLFSGDVLTLYAISGFVILPMLHWSARRQLLAGLVWYAAGTLLMCAAMGSPAMLEGSPERQAESSLQWQGLEKAWQDRVAETAQEQQVVQSGNFAAVIRFRVTEHAGALTQLPWLAVMETIPMMLIGMALYRMGFFASRPNRRRLALAWLGLIGGALATLPIGLWVMAERFPPFLTDLALFGLSAFPRLPMVIGAAALLVWLTPLVQQGWLGGRIIAAGRMAFSNYIGTSLVMVLLFQVFATDRFGMLHRLDLLGYVGMGCLLMLGWSEPWLRRCRHGPLEWLWRCLVYGRWLPFRR